ncbi:unnamed protein product [Arctogadus glacialis]
MPLSASEPRVIADVFPECSPVCSVPQRVTSPGGEAGVRRGDVIRNVKNRLKPTRGPDPLRTRTAPVPNHFPYVDGGNNLRSPIMERARLLAVLCELLSTSADDKGLNRRCEYRN